MSPQKPPQRNPRFAQIGRAADEMQSTTSDAARDVLAERRRQREVEGWTPEHDDAHDPMTMALAGASYVLSAAGRGSLNGCPSILWPWSSKWWKPSSPRRDLVKAGALILAEIERLDRIAASQRGEEV